MGSTGSSGPLESLPPSLLEQDSSPLELEDILLRPSMTLSRGYDDEMRMHLRTQMRNRLLSTPL